MDKKILSFDEYVIKDKEYFTSVIKEMRRKCKNSTHDMARSEHVAKHPNGQVNIALFDGKNEVMQRNGVTKENPKGVSVFIYKID